MISAKAAERAEQRRDHGVARQSVHRGKGAVQRAQPKVFGSAVVVVQPRQWCFSASRSVP